MVGAPFEIARPEQALKPIRRLGRIVADEAASHFFGVKVQHHRGFNLASVTDTLAWSLAMIGKLARRELPVSRASEDRMGIGDIKTSQRHAHRIDVAAVTVE